MKSERNDFDIITEMAFGEFTDIYLDAVGTRVTKKTLTNKKSIVKKYILPYFGQKIVRDISQEEIRKWQDEMSKTVDPKTGRPYASSYIKTMHGHLMAVLNYAEECNNSTPETETRIWEPEQYRQFAETMMDKPPFFYAFEVMYWCGLSGREVLALTADDIDLEKRVLSVTGSLLPRSRDEAADPANHVDSIRCVALPNFLCNELKDYMGYIYKPSEDGRLFPISKLEMIYEVKRGAEKADLPEIKADGLKQSHRYLLLDQGFSLHDAEARMGTERCNGGRQDFHGGPSKQTEIAKELDRIKRGWFRS